jgi:hypothetical protein
VRAGFCCKGHSDEENQMKPAPDEHRARWELLKDERFARDAAVFVPNRCFADDGSLDLASFMAGVNEIIATRGMVLADGQVISTPCSDRLGYELYGDDSSFDTPPPRHWGKHSVTSSASPIPTRWPRSPMDTDGGT